MQDYLWRWGTDWFWCSKNLGAQKPQLRRLLGRKHLNSRTYTRIMRWRARWKERWNALLNAGWNRGPGLSNGRGLCSEPVIQEQALMRLGGIKSLYSDSLFTRAEFERCDPRGQMLGLFEKCVLRA